MNEQAFCTLIGVFLLLSVPSLVTVNWLYGLVEGVVTVKRGRIGR